MHAVQEIQLGVHQPGRFMVDARSTNSTRGGASLFTRRAAHWRSSAGSRRLAGRWLPSWLAWGCVEVLVHRDLVDEGYGGLLVARGAVDPVNPVNYANGEPVGRSAVSPAAHPAQSG